MQYRTYPPSNFLSKYIRYYWTLEKEIQTESINKERIFPDGCMELVFHYGDLFKKYSGDFKSRQQPRSFIHGQLKRYIDVEPTGKIGVFSIRFLPGGLQPFLKMDVADLTEKEASVEDIWGWAGILLEEKIMEAPTSSVRIKIVEDFLQQQMATSVERFLPIDYCVHSILHSRGSASIQSMSNEINLGRRQLERRFTASVGLSPKLLMRIVRFQNTLHHIDKKAMDSLTGIAYANGFYDQSHFIKDFKEFTGNNPRKYFNVDLELAKYLTSS